MYGDHTSIETVGPSSDGSIDHSVKSAVVGKEVLGRYLKKTGNVSSGLPSKIEVDAETSHSCHSTPASINQTITSITPTSSSLTAGGSVHVHAPAPVPAHLRIQSLYPSPLYSSLKYKVSHSHSLAPFHQHSLAPPRYSSPPPLPRPSTENPYEYSLGGILTSKPYNHAPAPSIDSVYSRPHSHSHSHASAPSSYVYEPLRISQPDYIQLPYSEASGTIKKEPARIRIPSNTSVTSRNSIGRISSSSIEHLSEHGSPMPNFHVEILSPGRPGTSVGSRSSVNEYSWSAGAGSKFKPAPDELRR